MQFTKKIVFFSIYCNRCSISLKFYIPWILSSAGCSRQQTHSLCIVMIWHHSQEHQNLKAETSVSNLTRYRPFIGDDKKICFLEWPPLKIKHCILVYMYLWAVISFVFYKQINITNLPLSQFSFFSSFRIFSIVRPRKLLYMAIDGVVRCFVFMWSEALNFIWMWFYFLFVYIYSSCLLLFQAPRAKMNQQRSRRFRASKETK